LTRALARPVGAQDTVGSQQSLVEAFCGFTLGHWVCRGGFPLGPGVQVGSGPGVQRQVGVVDEFQIGVEPFSAQRKKSL